MNERILLYTTCFINCYENVLRYKRWLHFVKRWFKGGCIVLIDDGSDYKFLTRLHLPIYLPNERINNPPEIFIIHFEDNLGRPVTGIIPGWYRSFSFGAELGIRFNVDRLIHIESDTYVLSKKLWTRLLTAKTWSAPYCREMGGAETTIQTIPRKWIPYLWDYYKVGKRFWYRLDLAKSTYIPEYVLPVEEYWFDLVGGRLGEDWWTESIPIDIDYVANVGEISGKNDANNIVKINEFFSKLDLLDVD